MNDVTATWGQDEWITISLHVSSGGPQWVSGFGERECNQSDCPFDLPFLHVVTSAEIGDVVLAPLVDIHVASFAFESLVDQSVEEAAAVVAESWTCVSRGLELVLPDAISTVSLVQSGTYKANISMTAAVHDQRAGDALEPLFPEPPYEFLAVAAESRLLEEAGSESDEQRKGQDIIAGGREINIILSADLKECPSRVYRWPRTISTCFFFTAPRRLMIMSCSFSVMLRLSQWEHDDDKMKCRRSRLNPL